MAEGRFSCKNHAMGYIFYNANPSGRRVGDCTVRAISKITEKTWNDTYINLCLQGYMLKDMPSANHVWGAYLQSLGFNRNAIPNSCPECYTVAEFAMENPRGAFLLATGTHVVAVIDGNYYDAWDSGDEVPTYYWQRGFD